MMKEFNYKRAWRELAAPAYQSLPSNVRGLVRLTQVLCQDLRKDSHTLDMIWPDEEHVLRVFGEKTIVTLADPRASIDLNDALGFRERFEKIPSEILAAASRVVYSYGHWGFTEIEFDEMICRTCRGESHGGDFFCTKCQCRGKEKVKRLTYFGTEIQDGTSWKFSNYADQVLSQKIGIKNRRVANKGNGISYEVLEGFLRIQIATPDSWSWREVGLGTASTYELVQKVSGRPSLPVNTRISQKGWYEFDDRAGKWAEKVKEELSPKQGFIAGFMNLDRFMEERAAWKVGT